MSSTKEDEVVLFVKQGHDEQSFGACHQCQRTLMLVELKASSKVMPQPRIVPVSLARPPVEFRNLDLRLRIPVLHIVSSGGAQEFDPLDSADDIVNLLESRYPGGVGIVPSEIEAEADQASRDFFSRFCFLIRGVAKDSAHLEGSLRTFDEYLRNSSRREGDFLCGSQPGLLDCEVLPKLHQVRVAAQAIKGYSIPAAMCGIWRYLHAAYAHPAFTKSCPPDREIVLHWLEHCSDADADAQATKRIRKLLTQVGQDRNNPAFSFTIPAVATPVIID